LRINGPHGWNAEDLYKSYLNHFRTAMGCCLTGRDGGMNTGQFIQIGLENRNDAVERQAGMPNNVDEELLNAAFARLHC
jgi:hypothetical protein